MIKKTLERLKQVMVVDRMWLFYFNTTTQQHEYIEEQLLSYDKGGVPHIDLIQPVTVEQVKKLKIASSDDRLNSMKFKGIMPYNVLYLNASPIDFRIMWYVPSKIRHLNFDKSLGIKSGNYAAPPIIFDYSQEETGVFSYNPKDVVDFRKEAYENQVYHCPLFNINEEGGLCWGSVKDKKITFDNFEELIRKVEGMFFSGTFTHSSTAHNIVSTTTLNEYWNSPEAKKKFNNQILNPYGKTIEELI